LFCSSTSGNANDNFAGVGLRGGLGIKALAAGLVILPLTGLLQNCGLFLHNMPNAIAIIKGHLALCP